MAKDIAQALAIQKAYSREPAKPIEVELFFKDPADADWRIKECGCKMYFGETKIEHYSDGYQVRSWPKMRVTWCENHTQQLETERAAMRERLLNDG